MFNRREFVIFFSLILSCLINLGNCDMEKLKQMGEMIKAECQGKFDVTDEQIMELKKKDMKDVDAQSRNVKCFVNCGMELMQTMKNGKFQLDTVKTHMQALPNDIQELVNTAMTPCLTSADDYADHCDGSYAFLKCFRKDCPFTEE